jgi:IS5 family transposase
MAFHKKASLTIEDMVKSRWVYRKLRNFRAGIEAGISCLKRAYGLARCTSRNGPLQGLCLVLCRRLQSRSLRPLKARLISKQSMQSARPRSGQPDSGASSPWPTFPAEFPKIEN